MSKSSDTKIIQKATADKRIVLTFDFDFGDILTTSRKALPSVIIFRTHNQTPKHVQHYLTQVLSECSELLEKGTILIIQNRRYRIRELPISCGSLSLKVTGGRRRPVDRLVRIWSCFYHRERIYSQLEPFYFYAIDETVNAISAVKIDSLAGNRYRTANHNTE